MLPIKTKLTNGDFDATLWYLYGEARQAQKAKYAALTDAFEGAFGESMDAALFSAPGRSEIGGNHTDHQLGRVLAATVTMDTRAVVAPRSDNIVRIHSQGYTPLCVSLDHLAPNAAEENASEALVRGIAERLAQTGRKVGGFDAVTASDVPKGSGLSSSAAFSILVCTIFSVLYNDGEIPPVEQALASKYAENRHFGKPSGLMDQLACAVGGFIAIDFEQPEEPKIEKIDCDLSALGYAICIVNCGGNHADLTHEYAAVAKDMGDVARVFGKTVLREVDEAEFYASLGQLRKSVSDRALLRAMHFFDDNARVPQQAQALKNQDIETFRRLMNASGRSSFMMLQNVCPTDASERGLALALALSERTLGDRGAWRVHGGGFAGTILALVPLSMMAAYQAQMEHVFGRGCCYRFAVRPVGGVKIG
ncbi:MAG: galactokinase family protein [Eubacteriales bacterium]|jgi:galactokinase|nr:galactokinase family protein [Eubacteriales bacterium]